eukprot:6339385-Karenia_brevis.AAC.1
MLMMMMIITILLKQADEEEVPPTQRDPEPTQRDPEPATQRVPVPPTQPHAVPSTPADDALDDYAEDGGECIRHKAHPLMEKLAEAPNSDETRAMLPSVKKAIASAQDNITEQQKTVLWARMFRRVTSPECPPVVKEKWLACKNSKALKNNQFSTFLACGGNVGLMETYENARRRDEE